MTDLNHNPATDGGTQSDPAVREGSEATVTARRPIPLRGGEPVTIRAADGALLNGELLLPAGGPPRVVAALSHAMMVDRRTLDLSGRLAARLTRTPPGQAARPAEGAAARDPDSAPGTGGILTELLAAGVAVLWFDQRGHGQSGPTPTQGGSWDYDDLVADAGAVAGYLRTRLPATRRVAIGHSLFSHVALAYQAQAAERLQVPALYPPSAPAEDRAAPALYDGLVVIGGNVWLRELEPSWLRFVRKRLSYATLLLATRPLGYLPVRRLGMGTADEAGAYLEQMGQWVRRGDWTDRAGRSYLAALRHVRAPILSIAGAGDRLMAVPECQLALLRRTAGPVTHWLIGRAQGDALDPGHMELVLDARLRPRWRALARWVGALGQASAPGG